MLRFERAGKIIVINGWSGNFHLYVSGGEDVSKVYVVPAGIPACRQAGNLYQKFRKLLFYPLNYGTNDFGNLGNFPVRLSPLMDILSIPAVRQAGNYGTRKIIR
jgi:hypothetical protein